MLTLKLTNKKHILLVFCAVFLFMKSMFYAPKYSKEINSNCINKNPKFKKLIYFVIDGLRFDGVIDIKESKNLYHNNFNFDYVKEKHLFFAVAGIPTATTCRILSMMTGKPSNQMDYLFTFFHFEHDGDSLIEQAIAKKKTLFHYGDKMWSDLFTGVRKCTCNFCSYGKERIFEKEKETYDLFISGKKGSWPRHEINLLHMISVDSLGHELCDLNRGEIRERAVLYNTWIKEIYNKMDKDTLLVVTSDHGVTNQGEHVGMTDDELASFCLFLSKSKIILSKEKSKKRKFYSSKYIDEFNVNNDDVIHQDDILATVCYLMGLSVPSNACGSVIEKFDTGETVNEILKIKKRVAKENSIYNLTEETFLKEIPKEESNKLNFSAWVSLKLKHELFKCNYFIAGISIFMQIIAVFLFMKKISIAWYDIPALVFLAYDSCSFWTFAYRDLYLCVLLILYSMDVGIFLCIIYYLKQPKNLHWEVLRAAMFINEKIPIKEEMLIILFFANYLYKQAVKKNILTNNIVVFFKGNLKDEESQDNKNTKNNEKLLSFINHTDKKQKICSFLFEEFILFYEMFAPVFIDNNIEKISTFSNVFSLFFVFYSKKQAILLNMLYLSVKQLKITKTLHWILFFMIQYTLNCYNFDYQLNKLNLQCAFKLVKHVDIPVAAFCIACHIFLPALSIVHFNSFSIQMHKTKTNKQIERTEISNKLILMNSFWLLISSFSAFVMHGEFVWLKFFGDRYIIVIAMTLIETLLLSLRI